jgi:hypothetical protein
MTVPAVDLVYVPSALRACGVVKLNLRAVVLGGVALAVGACAEPSVGPPTQQVMIAPGLSLVLPAPADLGRSLNATQLVTAQYGAQTIVFEGHISVTPERFLLIVIDSFGRRALTVAWTGSYLTAVPAPFLPASLRPENMLADLVLLYWPEDAVRRSLRGAGSAITSDGHARSISLAGREVIHIDFKDLGAQDPWVAHLHYRNLAWAYEFEIWSSLSAS